jgi:prevent-host-death family protein
MEKIGAREARLNFADVLSRCAYGKDRIVVTKNGKDVAAVIPIEDLRALEEIEDAADSRDARRILASKEKSRKLEDVIREDRELVKSVPAKKRAEHR